MPKLFRPFVQLDSSLTRQQAGTGLGLALVKRLIDLHGGSVRVESAPDAGSRFTVSLPYLPTGATQKIPANIPLMPAPVNATNEVAGTAMVVDDNEVNINLLRDVLDALHFTVSSSNSAEDFLARVTEVRPDIILMDIQMPNMDGLEATRRLRAMPDPYIASIPVIAVTALAMPGDRERCLQAGANEYMSKPLNLKQLSSIIKQQIGNRS
jgi:CheY-like chemotaxis protein